MRTHAENQGLVHTNFFFLPLSSMTDLVCCRQGLAELPRVHPHSPAFLRSLPSGWFSKSVPPPVQGAIMSLKECVCCHSNHRTESIIPIPASPLSSNSFRFLPLRSEIHRVALSGPPFIPKSLTQILNIPLLFDRLRERHFLTDVFEAWIRV